MNAQAMEALAHGDRLRLYRAGVKRAVASLPRAEGRREVARLIRANEPDWHGCRIIYLLTMPRHTGPVMARKWVETIGASETRLLGQLTDRQRDLLATLVEAV